MTELVERVYLYYDGYDGNQIGYLVSSSCTQVNHLWTGSTHFFLTSPSNTTLNSINYKPFSGSYQELRFWAKTGSVESFKDFSVQYGVASNYNGKAAPMLVIRKPEMTKKMSTPTKPPRNSLSFAW